MKLFVRLAINVFALLIVAYIVPGFILRDLTSAVVASVIIGVVNTFIRPIVQLVTLPITLLTFGLFAFLINVALLWVVSLIVPGFEINSFLTAILASLLLSLVSWFLHKLARE
jgi:putative membrane protein